MKEKFRLIFGRKMEVPLANSKIALALAAVLMLAGTCILWHNAADTCFLKRENAPAVTVTAADVEVTGEGGYVPRMEIRTEGGRIFTLTEKQAGNFFSRARSEIQAGDELTLRLSRGGHVMEVQEGDSVWVPFNASASAHRVSNAVDLTIGAVFAVLSALLLLRTAALGAGRKEKFRFGAHR